MNIRKIIFCEWLGWHSWKILLNHYKDGKRVPGVKHAYCSICKTNKVIHRKEK